MTLEQVYRVAGVLARVDRKIQDLPEREALALRELTQKAAAAVAAAAAAALASDASRAKT